MKPIKLFCIAVLIALVTVSTVTAKELPSKTELNNFLSDIPKEDGFIKTASEAALDEHPEWPWDKWTSAISFYYNDPSSKKGYGSIYFDDNGKKMTASCKDCKLVRSYKGSEAGDEKEVDDEEDNENDESPREESSKIIKDGIRNEGKHTLEDLRDAIDDYTGKLTCTSKSCAESLCAYLNEDGWDAEVEFCIKVTTEDEGERYIILG